MDGILVVNKPKEYTSHDAVAVVKGICKEKHLGHTGTLDPNATGVLPICFGYATRLIEYMDTAPKRYVAKAKLGIVTDSQDIWGRVLEEKAFKPVSESEILTVLPSFIGEIEQTPPVYSAIRVNGRHLYSYAHSGEAVEIPSRKVKVYNIKLLRFDEEAQEFEIDVECGRGTYIRTICSDIGNLLGPGACLTELTRVSACGFSLEDSVALDDLRNMTREDVLRLIHPAESAVSFMNRVDISKEQCIDFANGKHLKVQQREMSFCDPVCIFCEDKFCGIGVWDNPNRIKPSKVFIRW